MSDRDDLIRKRVQQIWEEQGRPVGQDGLHWRQAIEEIDGLARAAGDDYAADERRAGETASDRQPLPTTREAAAFALANSPPVSDR